MRKSMKLPQVVEYLKQNPDAKAADIAKKFGVHLSMAYKAKRMAKEAIPAISEATLIVHPGQAEIITLVEDRGSRYGKFKDHAQVTQELKRVLARHAHVTERTFTDSQWEALEMICHKIGRIVNGDPNYIDSWADIAGYAQLVADELKGIER